VTQSLFWNKSQNSSVGIFLDAENLTQFLKAEGGRRLVDWAVEFGNPIVRRAYGDWSLPGLHIHQRLLITNGFKLVHSPHLISGKNAADIAMVMDIMDTNIRHFSAERSRFFYDSHRR
jgi:hypothetical protein